MNKKKRYVHGLTRWDLEPDLAAIRRARSLEKTNPAEAKKIYEDLVPRGSPVSMESLGRLAAVGATSPVDLTEAEMWYSRAMRAGHVPVSINLGKLYCQNKEYQKSVMVLEWGSKNNYPATMFRLACMKLDGIGTPMDIDGAKKLLEGASGFGHYLSTAKLGRLMRQGRFGWRSAPRGVTLWFLAARQYIEVSRENPRSDLLIG